MSTKSKARFERRHHDEIIAGTIVLELLSALTFGLLDDEEEDDA